VAQRAIFSLLSISQRLIVSSKLKIWSNASAHAIAVNFELYKLPPIRFVFFINSIHRHHPALLRLNTLILNRLLTFLLAFQLVLKFFISQSLFPP